MPMPKFILYACPVGELAAQLDSYFEKSRLACGPNSAHNYMPHCTLTGFFDDESGAAPNYAQSLERCYERLQRSQPSPVVEVKSLSFHPDWHGLVLASDWLKKVAADFACTATSPTRTTALRLKEWLHLSLAYDFCPEQADTLKALATELVDPHAAVGWELRFYQRKPDNSWRCHQRLKLGYPSQR